MQAWTRGWVVGLALGGIGTGAALAQRGGDPAPIKARFEKHEYQIPMRDGVKLFTAVFTPRSPAGPSPFLLTRTPYSVAPYGPEAYPSRLGPTPKFHDLDYIFVSQDVRGRYHSEGHFVHMTPHKDVKRGPTDVDESSDTYDTIEWLLKHVPNNNGRVGLWGISYGGFFTTAGMIDAHPALKAASPQAPQADWFLGDDTHHNGAFFLTSTFNFMAMCGKVGTGAAMSCGTPFEFGTKDGAKFFQDLGPLANADAKYFHGQVPGWTEMMEHGTYDDFWKARNILPHLKNITPAVLTVGGWYDANNFYGALHVFQAIERQSPKTDNAIVIGPWFHGQWAFDDGRTVGGLDFGSGTSIDYRDQVLVPFFEYHLRGTGHANPAKAFVFETGANRWRTFDSWPPKEASARSIYLGPAKSLSFNPPKEDARPFDEWTSDPAHPVPFVGKETTDMDPDYMAQDQRFAAGRPDVVTYEGEPLAAPLTIAGAVSPTIYASTTGTDGDWVVKLIDVHPDGFQELVRGDVIRAKFRDSFEHPKPLVPGQVTKLEFAMPDVLHTFGPGHRMMVQVQGSWFPLVDRNPQKFVDIYKATAADFQSATMRVHRGRDQASRIEVTVLTPRQTP